MDPAEYHPVGSEPWAGRMSARLQGEFTSVDDRGIRRFLQVLETALPGEPWRHYPPDQPWGSIEAWSMACFDLPFDSIIRIVREVEPDRARQLEKVLAEHQRDTVKPGGDQVSEAAQSNHDKIMNASQGTSAAYLLRRLARDWPDILAAYERGEYKSARAAALAAGIIKPPDAYKQLCRAWAVADDDQRARFLAYVGQGTR